MHFLHRTKNSILPFMSLHGSQALGKRFLEAGNQPVEVALLSLSH